MAKTLYPKDWKEIATAIKQKSDWRCSRCGLVCLSPQDERAKKWDKSTRSKHTLQVHHCNFNPQDSNAENLAALCAPCHLWFHRFRKGNISPGQLSLDISVASH